MHYTIARYLYTFLLYLVLPLVLLRLWLRGKKQPAYRQRWGERLGIYKTLCLTNKKNKKNKTIWIHTVSVGEFIAAKPLIDDLIKSNHFNLIITCTTITGSQRILNAYNNTIDHCYIPYDIPFFIQRFLMSAKPDMAIFMETELWPNTLHKLKASNIKTLLINARMSEKSAKGYQRFAWLTRPMLNILDNALIQSTADSERLKNLGLTPKKSIITGNIKFDIAVNTEIKNSAAILKKCLNPNNYFTWIAASTHKGEDEIILNAHKSLLKKNPHCQLILVPRHPERFLDVEKLASSKGFSTIKKSTIDATSNTISHPQVQVVIGDTMGELMVFFGISDVAFVGGSLINNGGHNTLEPAAWSLPILSGSSTFNFSDITQKLKKANAITLCNTAEDICHELFKLMENSHYRNTMGNAAFNVVMQNQGAKKRVLEHILTELSC